MKWKQKKDLLPYLTNQLIYKLLKLKIMKNLTKIIIGVLLGLPMISNAQFQIVPIGGGRTIPFIRKVGIGNFPTSGSINAKFHINQFLLAPDLITDGFLFRTDGSNAVTNQWQIFTGVTNATLLERFRVSVPANSNNVVIAAVQNGYMAFATDSTERMQIAADGNITINSLACANCIVTTTETGQLYTQNINLTQLLAKIETLEQKITQLENPLTEK